MGYSLEKYSYRKKFLGNKIALSKLFFQATKEYEILFKKFGLNKHKFFYNILNKKNSEIEELTIIKKKNKLLGFISGFSSDEYKFRKLISFLVLKNMIFPKNLTFIPQNKMSRLEPLEKSYYLSRISIDKKNRKKGLADRLLKKFTDNIKKSKHKFITLHVNKNNKSAIKFYIKNNFKIIKMIDVFIYMRKKI